MLLPLVIGIATLNAQTFYRDVVPLLQRHCQDCHRSGEVGPFPLMTYEQTRPWAAAIKSAVATRKMPPWFADPTHGHFSNERRMTQDEIATLVKWVGSSRVDLQACKLEYSIVSPK